MSARRALRPLRVALPFVGVLLCVGGLGVLGCSGETSALADADVPTAITNEGIRAPLRVRAALVTESRVGGLADDPW